MYTTSEEKKKNKKDEKQQVVEKNSIEKENVNKEKNRRREKNSGKLCVNKSAVDEDRAAYYVNSINKQINDKDVKNIALVGPYGSGKSTILNELLEQNQKKCININMIEFSDDVNNSSGQKVKTNEQPNNVDLCNETEKTKSDMKIIQQVESSIIQQLIYQEKPERLPFSKVKHEKPRCISLFVGLFVSLCFLSAIFFSCNLSHNFMQLIINFEISKSSILSAVLLLAMVIISFFLVRFFFIYSYKNFHKVRINIPSQAEIEYKKSENIYTKNFDELLYFFKHTSYDTVIFEDIDRYNDLLFFSHLRELNSLLNKSKSLNKKISFIYAIRDDLFSDKDKTKFFDYILPVIPIMDYSNSAEKFKEHLHGEKCTEETIDFLSNYVSDYRTLKNICHEYNVYKDLKKDEIPNYDRLLAIITLKNLYPAEFFQLQFNESILNYIFTESKRVINEKTDKLQKEYNLYSTALKENTYLMDPDFYVLGFVKNIIKAYCELNKIDLNNCNFSKNVSFIDGNFGSLSEIFNKKVNWENVKKVSPMFFTYNIYSGNTGKDIILTNYQQAQLKHYIYLHDNKEYLENKSEDDIKEKINSLQNEISNLNGIKLSNLFNEDPLELDNIIRKYYSQNGKDPEIKEKKTTKGFNNFIKNLILRDLINENYNILISLTYGATKDGNDNRFIQHVSSKEDSDFLMKLKDIKYIHKILKNDIYDSKYSFNMYVLKYLAKDTKQINNLRHLLKLNSDRLEFVYENIEANKSNLSLITETIKVCNNFDKLLNIQNEAKREYWFKVLICLKNQDFKKLSISDNLKEEIKNYDLIKLNQIEEEYIKNFIDNCISLNIKIDNIIGVDRKSKLYELIINNNLYEINFNNIKTIKPNFIFAEMETQVQEYLRTDLDVFLRILVEHNISVNQSEEFYQLLVKNCKDRDLFITYIITNGIVINDISSISSVDELASLCANKNYTLSLLNKKKLSIEEKSLLICKLFEYNSEIMDKYGLDICEIIKAEKLYTKALLEKSVYLKVFKDANITQDNKAIILDNIIGLCDKNELARIIRAYAREFRSQKNEIKISNSLIHKKLSEKLQDFKIYKIISEENNEITLQKISLEDK